MRTYFLIACVLMVRTLYCGEIYEMVASSPFVIEKNKVETITTQLGIDTRQFLQQLLPVAKKFARPQISNYKVGVAALGKSGNIYLGVNLEFAGLSLNEAVHGEQFLVTNARSHGEQELVAIAVSAAPCGHCRQFLYEMGGGENLLILTPNGPPMTLASLLPEPFGPQDLGLASTLKVQSPIVEGESSLTAKALEAASVSYAPYSNSKSGVAIQTRDGFIYTGSYLENVAFNPSLSPLQTALVALVIGKKEYKDIVHVVLAEQTYAVISQDATTSRLLQKIAPDAIYEKVLFD